MLDAPEQDPVDPGDPASPPHGEAEQPLPGPRWPRALRASATRRALLLTALGGLLIAGLVTAIPAVGRAPERLAGYIASNPVPSTGAKINASFNRVASGDCLMWPDGTPESAAIVSCADEHRFEVAESIDMRTFPGMEYGQNAAPPSPARIQQISEEQCEAAVRRYLGTKFDPNSKFTISMLWPGDRAWRQAGERRMLCGLQSPGPNNQQLAFKGKVATSTSPRSGRPVPAWASMPPPTSRSTCRWTARHRTRWRYPARQPGREVSRRAAERTRAGRVHQGRVHPDDGRLPRTPQVAYHHPDADLPHADAAQLVGG